MAHLKQDKLYMVINKVSMIKKLFSFGCCMSFILLIGCSSKISIDKLPYKRVSFSELPDTAKKIYNAEVEVDSFRRVFKCVDCKQYSMEYHSMEDVADLAKHGFNYDFSINGKKYVLKANKGNPFIYVDGYFYYPDELNLNKANYQQVFYNKIQLR